MSTADAAVVDETTRRPLGFLDVELPDELFEDLPIDELEAWEGGNDT